MVGMSPDSNLVDHQKNVVSSGFLVTGEYVLKMNGEFIHIAGFNVKVLGSTPFTVGHVHISLP